MPDDTATYRTETVGSIMSRSIPTCHLNDTLGEVLKNLSSQSWDTIRNIYVVDNERHLLGFIDLATVHSAHKSKINDLMKPAKSFLRPEEDQEKAVFMAIRDDIISIPVVDNGNRLLGAVTAHTLIDVLHAEHIEDALVTAGIRGRGSNIFKLATARTGLVVRSRIPWLILGLMGGLLLGFISSFFEESLKASIALAYFVPVVAYVADSVGVQTETITIRAIANVKINFLSYLLKEASVGVILGLVMGFLGGLGALVISHSGEVALVVGLALFVASVVATCLKTIVPMAFKSLDKDPALASGPLSTALQDVISVLIYFLFAVVIA